MVNHLRAETGAHATASTDFATAYMTLKTMLSQVTATNEGLYASLQGQAQLAFQGAHDRWNFAANAAQRLLDEVASNLGISGADYEATDTERAQVFNASGANLT
ncbi:WXG100 family type VII secretion target [Nocardia brasiliensis]|uniref:WXG100 family type VII secretion target n=1 Tax=Nocardia brasiliensis TaxID=37326 RepID=UPI002455C206|nr:WXG100 family type VII secretion target [Nocardia brasiliensis]